MARITPSSGISSVNIEELEDYEPYRAWLRAIDFQTGSAEYGSEQRLVLDWSLTDEEDDKDTIRDWLSLRLGRQQSGQVSKLRALLNALSGKEEQAEVKWFDTETLEWSYDGEHAENKLGEGAGVLFRGKHGVKQDGTAKFTITTYQSAQTKKRKIEPARPSRDESEKEDEPPF